MYLCINLEAKISILREWVWGCGMRMDVVVKPDGGWDRARSTSAVGESWRFLGKSLGRENSDDKDPSWMPCIKFPNGMCRDLALAFQLKHPIISRTINVSQFDKHEWRVLPFPTLLRPQPPNYKLIISIRYLNVILTNCGIMPFHLHNWYRERWKAGRGGRIEKQDYGNERVEGK